MFYISICRLGFWCRYFGLKLYVWLVKGWGWVGGGGGVIGI